VFNEEGSEIRLQIAAFYEAMRQLVPYN